MDDEDGGRLADDGKPAQAHQRVEPHILLGVALLLEGTGQHRPDCSGSDRSGHFPPVIVRS